VVWKLHFTFRHEVDPNFSAVLQSLIGLLGDYQMGKLTDQLKKIDAKLDEAIGRVQGDVATLQAKLAELQAKVEEGTQTPEDEALIETITSKLDALDPTKEDTIPPVDTTEA
jgi:predicted nuclease with TOPRIM domain